MGPHRLKREIFYYQNQSHHLLSITKTCLYNFDPLKPHFYIVKLGFTGVYIIFLISAENIDYGYSLESPHRGGSNEYPQSMFWAETWKKYQNFYLIFFYFLMVKFSVYLNRHVFVMFVVIIQSDINQIINAEMAFDLRWSIRLNF